jgi:hypothetical protein
MKRCCAERNSAIQILMQAARSYDGIDFCKLSEKENNFLNLLVDNGVGKVYYVRDIDDTILMKYYKFNPNEEE